VDLTESQHPVLKDLTDPRSGTAFEPPLVSGWFPVQAPLEEGTEVLLHLRDLSRSPWLLERRFGRGRVLLCTSSADTDWTGGSLFFAAFVQEAASYLAEGGTLRRDLLVHEPVSVEVPDTAREISVRVRSADRNYDTSVDFRDERRADPAFPDAPAARVLTYTNSGRAGVYAFHWKAPGSARPDAALETVSSPFAVNIDPKEADAARVRAELLEDRFAMPGLGAAGEGAGGREHEREAARGDLTGAALGAGVLLLLAEMFLAAIFGKKRR
jgi:hypothetical protein